MSSGGDINLARQLAEMMRPDMPTDVPDSYHMQASGGKVVWLALEEAFQNGELLWNRQDTNTVISATYDYALTGDGFHKFFYRLAAEELTIPNFYYRAGELLVKLAGATATLVGGGDQTRLEWDPGIQGSLVWSTSGANLRLTVTTGFAANLETNANVYLHKRILP